MNKQNNKVEYKFVDGEQTLSIYSNGLKAGDTLILTQDLKMCAGDRDTSVNFASGSQWVVIPGLKSEPNILWLRNPNGERHTWDLDDVFISFKLLE